MFNVRFFTIAWVVAFAVASQLQGEEVDAARDESPPSATKAADSDDTNGGADTPEDGEASFGESEAVQTEIFSFGKQEMHIYGYFSTRFEKVYSEPTLSDGVTVRESAPAEWSLPFFNVMLQHRMGTRFKVFVNLNGQGGGEVDVRNMWGEYSFGDYLSLRVGKIYRQFGLYNEILDAVPTYVGIEPPELFDGDHLILSRTTTFMALGRVDVGPGNFNYAFTTGNGEGDPQKGAVPLGMNANYKFRDDAFTIGMSAYSSNGPTTSDIGLGEGSPNSGVLPWMASDRFEVYGGYFEAKPGNWILQTEFWNAPHSAERDPSGVVQLIENTSLNAFQRERFLLDPTAPVEEANVRTDADYSVQTWYVRSGYSFETTNGEFVPYFQWDWYKNPETIADKSFGGDNEAGVADDGQFHKSTIGVVYRPIPEVAIKFDTSHHIYEFNGENVSYPEIRFDFSFVFGQ